MFKHNWVNAQFVSNMLCIIRYGYMEKPQDVYWGLAVPKASMNCLIWHSHPVSHWWKQINTYGRGYLSITDTNCVYACFIVCCLIIPQFGKTLVHRPNLSSWPLLQHWKLERGSCRLLPVCTARQESIQDFDVVVS